ncbi:hypothetical protein JXA40_03515 [bacterium]|nr:hypothetical protein [candidate division CSSED10-310 bacterium]
MKEQDRKRHGPLNFGSIFIGMLTGFLGAAVLYQKHFPDWVPQMFHGNPILFFSLFTLVCGVLGYIWAITD